MVVFYLESSYRSQSQNENHLEKDHPLEVAEAYQKLTLALHLVDT
eukprot:CAMPEP_0169293440 /NCGR_PEP_ID=MMETSP1016-20121227/63297_1 /TAXON_ID=342587 /ORGANISM="Karlodinium micrum, Strain CCMP2283" /LENGTH=44 /DNA_ID= /DNA_START= /DNA_END= /DNA_ORIENTATION=